MNPVVLSRCARQLRAGGVVACPTEGVWGLSADPWNAQAVEHVLALKQRPWDKGLILVTHDPEALAPFVAAPSWQSWQQALATWPGPVTWLFPKTAWTPLLVSGDQDTVAVRVTAHPVLAALCERFGGALISTSANPAGRPPAMSASEVRMYFGRELDDLLPGALGGRGAPSTIRDARSGKVMRA